jgi:signal transduction protein with GAF and PtsI domain
VNEPALTALCAAARAVTGAAAVSIAVTGENDLRYVAADGAGATEIVGTVLSGGRGLASFVAASGQAVALSRVATDPRFARDIAEGTGYVPEAMLLVPVLAADGDVAGVLSVLDRAPTTLGDADALAVAGRLADVATHVITAGADDDAEQLASRIARLDRPGRAAIAAVLGALGA